MPAKFNHTEASKIALQLTVLAVEQNRITHSTDSVKTATHVVEYFNTIYDALHDSEQDVVNV